MINAFEVSTAVLSLINSKNCSISLLRDILTTTYVETADDLFRIVNISKASVNSSYSNAAETLENGLRHGIQPIIISSDVYPHSLRIIADAPLILYARGNISVLDSAPGVAVVGTRKATMHGITIAERVSSYIGEFGIPVISGLALGIDAAAHEGALRSPTPTIAVLAHGLERASPRANAHLADRILDHGGLWVSEHPCGVSARPEYFVQRNRIQVGLASASIIVEGEEKSGSMTQAEFCLRNRRVLAAVLPEPGGVTTTQHKLPEMLISSRGAFAIRTKDDYPTLLALAMAKKKELVNSSRQN